MTHVPAPIRRRDRAIGVGEPVLARYERIAFEKPLVAPPGQPLAAFVCPGHPLLDAVIDLTLERHRDLLKRGAVLIDERDNGKMPRVLFSIEHALQDGSITRGGDRRIISKRVLYVELDNDGVTRHLHYAPYLDYRPLKDEDPAVDAILARPECAWIGRDLEQAAQAYAVADVVPEHLAEVRTARLALIEKTEAAVKDRLTKEISYWGSRSHASARWRSPLSRCAPYRPCRQRRCPGCAPRLPNDRLLLGMQVGTCASVPSGCRRGSRSGVPEDAPPTSRPDGPRRSAAWRQCSSSCRSPDSLLRWQGQYSREEPCERPCNGVAAGASGSPSWR